MSDKIAKCINCKQPLVFTERTAFIECGGCGGRNYKKDLEAYNQELEMKEESIFGNSSKVTEEGSEEAKKEDVVDINVHEFVRGEEVEVSSSPDFGSAYTSVAKYLGKVDSEYGHIVEVKGVDCPLGYKYIRKLPQVQEGTRKFTEKDVDEFIRKRKSDIGGILADCIKDFLKEHGVLEE